MNRFIASLLSCCVAIMIFVSPVLAGGGLISFEVIGTKDTLDMSPGDQYVVRPTVKTPEGGPAVNWPIKILLENPASSDYIAQSSDKTDENGTMYAKVISQLPGNRVLYAEVTMPDGSTYRSSVYILNYQGPSVPQQPVYPTSVPTPYTKVYEEPYPTTIPPMDQPLVLKVDYQKYLSGVKREVGVSWNKVAGAVKYNVYARLTDDNDWRAAIASTDEQNAILNVNAFMPFYLKVDACYSADNCVPSADVLLDGMGPSTVPEPTVVVDKSVAQLYDQVQTLQKELEESKKQQNEMQKVINNLVSILKRILPFW